MLRLNKIKLKKIEAIVFFFQFYWLLKLFSQNEGGVDDLTRPILFEKQFFQYFLRGFSNKLKLQQNTFCFWNCIRFQTFKKIHNRKNSLKIG